MELAGRLKCPRFSWHPYGRLECLSIPYKLIDAGLQPPQRRSLRAPRQRITDYLREHGLRL